MSIDKDRFLAGLAVLAGAFGREVDGPVQVAYYRVLNAALTTEEFERAVALTLSSETYWPSPAVILSKVKADDTGRALLAFEYVNRVVGAAGGYRFFPNEQFLELDAPTRAAISAVGGLAEIGNTTSERWPSLQKRFAAAYVESTHPTPRIAQPATDSRVRQLVASTASHLTSGRDRAANNHKPDPTDSEDAADD